MSATTTHQPDHLVARTRTEWRPRALRSKAPVYEQVADQLRLAIASGRLRIGDVLPGENDLAEQFCVSRGTVREALRVLASQGLIRTTRGVKGGSTVAQPSTDQLQQSLAGTLAMLVLAGDVPATMLVEAREVIEVPAAGLAAQRRADLRGYLPATTTRQRLHGGGGRSPDDFHMMLAAATGNPLLEVTLGPLLSVLHSSTPERATTAAVCSLIDRDHAAIAEAVRDGDVDVAEAQMRAHLHRIRGLALD